jgi:hypothetical protein
MTRIVSACIALLLLCSIAVAQFGPGGGAGGGGTPSGSAGGSLAGTYPTPTVAGIIDPVASYNAAGVITATTGTISASSKSLTVASPSGWSVGMGIAVANAGTGGNTELISSVTGISGSVFTLNDAAVATATTQAVNHDDTAAIKAAVASANTLNQRLRLRAGNYNVTSEIALSAPLLFECDGTVENIAQGAGEQTTTGGAVIWNRGKTNNVFNITSGYTTIHFCTIEQNASITPTAGCAITVGNGSVYVRQTQIINNRINGAWSGICLTGHVDNAVISGNIVYGLGGASNTDGAVHVDNASPAGGTIWSNNTFNVLNGGTTVSIINADTSVWSANVIVNGDPCLSITGSVAHQLFTGNSFESGTNVGPLVVLNGANVKGINFTGGEMGVSGAGGISITSAINTNVIGVDFQSITGSPVARSGDSGTNIMLNQAYAGTSAITNVINGTAAVTCSSGFSAITGRTVNGIVTAC